MYSKLYIILKYISKLCHLENLTHRTFRFFQSNTLRRYIKKTMGRSKKQPFCGGYGLTFPSIHWAKPID